MRRAARSLAATPSRARLLSVSASPDSPSPSPSNTAAPSSSASPSSAPRANTRPLQTRKPVAADSVAALLKNKPEAVLGERSPLPPPPFPVAPKVSKAQIVSSKSVSELSGEDIGSFFAGVALPEPPPRRLARSDFAESPSPDALSDGKLKSTPGLKPASEQRIMVRSVGLELVDVVKQAANLGTSTTRLLTGPRGCGKSATLLHLVWWARQNGWITMYIPRAADWMTGKTALEAGTGTTIPFVPSPITPDFYVQPMGALAVLQNMLSAHGEQLLKLPQRRKYTHGLYEGAEGTPSTLGHILMRGINSLPHAADSLYDLRMELSLVDEVPVLVAVDELDALYWPTGMWLAGKPIPASQLMLPRTFRFLGNVLGDVEAGSTPAAASAAVPGIKSPRHHAIVRPEHVLKRGALVGALQHSLLPPKHDKLPAPRRIDEMLISGCWKDRVGAYSTHETACAVAWYKGISPLSSPVMIRAFTGGVPEQVYKQTRSNLIDPFMIKELRDLKSP